MKDLYIKINSIIHSPLPWYKITLILLSRLFLRLIFFIGNCCDQIFFPGYRKFKIIKPVFLIGHPRSGTTFLHRFLLKINNNYRGMYLWEMILPSLNLRRLLKSEIAYFDRLTKKNLYNPEIHKTGLLEAETDDVALFFSSFEGLFFWLYFRSFNTFASVNELEADLTYHIKMGKTLNLLHHLHSKNLFKDKSRNKTMFSKSFSLIINIDEIIKSYPDSKIILLLRDPIEVIPSSMSLIKGLLQKMFGFDSLGDKTKSLFYSNLYQASLFFYKSLDNVLKDKTKIRENLHTIYYKNLKNDFKRTMYQLIDFLEMEKSIEIINELSLQENHQKSFKSRHQYSLEDFGLEENRIRKDFKFIYDNYDV